MKSAGYVKYLNTLQNVNADNPSAFTELSISSPFFRETMVERPVGTYITKLLQDSKPHILVLTGHAGDGKTAILYQALREWKAIGEGDKLAEISDVQMPNGRICRCIKDFSELEAERRKAIVQDMLRLPASGQCAFLVANTGPLISTFSELMDQDEVNKLVGAIDDNSGTIQNYQGVPIAAVNVATVDNSAFVKPYLDKVLAPSLWSGCTNCEKANYCPIYTNYRLMNEAKSHIADFISKHYIWQQEYGNKLTIRQIVAHLAYTITGGLECRQIKEKTGLRFVHLCSNQFFGYKGIMPDSRALTLKAVVDVQNEHYDQKRICADEQLLLKEDFSVFPSAVREIVENEAVEYHYAENWQQAVRRTYIFLNCDPDLENRKRLYQDIFSMWYPRYLEIRAGSPAGVREKDLVTDALKMLFLGSLTKEADIPVTMRREENSSQCVQLVYDSIQKKYLKLNAKQVVDFNEQPRFKLYVAIKSTELTTPLSLPLINHFEEMRRGAIQTNIDPQLSQGIDSLRAQLIALTDSGDENIEMRIITKNGWETISASFDGHIWYV